MSLNGIPTNVQTSGTLSRIYAREHRKRGRRKGCYVATAVYGSYDCPQVWTLRRFRDDTLAKTWYGRLFIRVYYAISPKLVNLWGDNAKFQGFWRTQLDKMVAKLQRKGYASSPYDDAP